MLSWLARRIVKDAWFVVATWAVIAFVLLTPALGGAGIDGLFNRLGPTKTSIDGSQSAQGQSIYSALQGDGVAVTLQVRGLDLDTQIDAVAAALAPVHADLNDLVGEVNVADPFVVPDPLGNKGVQAFIAQDHSGFLMFVTVNPNGREIASPDDTAYARKLQRDVQRVTDRLRRVPDDLRQIAPGVSGIVTTDALVSEAVNDQAAADLARGEALALPAALILMVLVFGGFLVAGMPLLGGITSIVSSLGVLWLASLMVDLGGLEVTVITMIGLGLSINNALLMTVRFREELGLGRADPRATAPPAARSRRRRTGRRDPLIAEAMERTMLTAGRTVLVTTAAVALPLAALVSVGAPSLRVTAIAGAVVVALAALSAITLVPAALVLLHGFMSRPPLLSRVPVLRALAHPVDGSSRDDGAFAALARGAQARPWPVLAACAALLALLAWPLAHLHPLVSDRELLPPNADQRVYQRVLEEQYPNLAATDAVLIMQATGDSAKSFIDEQVAHAPGVSSVTQTKAGQYTVAYLSLEGSASSLSAERAVAAVRALNPPADTWVTGKAATQVDFRSALVGALPIMIVIGMGAAMLLMLLMTGSLIIPLLALLTTALSLAASLGATTLLIQDGHLAGALGVTPIGGVEGYAVATALALGAGLAMSRELIILTRMRDRRARGERGDAVVAAGLQGTGRILSVAGAVLLVVLVSFTTGRLIAIKEVSLILALMVVIDAVIVRLLLFPAAMSLLGPRAWWAPPSLRRWADVRAGGGSWAPEQSADAHETEGAGAIEDAREPGAGDESGAAESGAAKTGVAE
ncbi:MMPL family transporter [Actinomyces sp. zg296]|uniref:MMPL family transporter n=1 Tax=Actinomyces sp. zg296 TaxID=2609289 RepID=UPI001359FB3F|nr:MMPL family transporter [Actinomyces sp. zg296]